MKLCKWIVFFIFLTLFSTKVKAQLTPDNTLGEERSTVNTVNDLDDHINNGAIRGTNLFHSFAEFNVNEGRSVFFSPSDDIQNILTRVTGSNISNIFGKLGVLGEANLFLINPNGIIFGENASLDLGGSFVSTTADALQFKEQGFFSATDPEVPPLLTVQPSAFLFNQVNANPIENNSTATAGIDPVGNDTSGLRVPDGSSLLLIGGDLILNGGNLQARGGRIELGGLKGEGIIELDIQNEKFSLIFPDNATLSNISLMQGAEVNVRGADEGNITINAQNFNLTEESVLRAGIDEGLGSITSQAGNIDIKAQDTIELNDGSFISHNINDDAIGNGGNVNITTKSLLLTNDSEISTSPFGQGNGGNINIDATNSIVITSSGNLNSSTFSTANAGDINLNSEGNIALNDQGNSPEEADINDEGLDITGIFSDADILIDGDAGNAGNITLNAKNISVKDGAQLSSNTFGSGDAGDINLNAQNAISFDGEKTSQINSSAFSAVDSGASGNGGEINVMTDSLFLMNGAQISVNTFGQGNAGEINIDARNTISLDGVGSGPLESGIFSGVSQDAEGNSGNININVNSLSLNNSAVISANTSGNGNGGEINIRANNLSANNGGQIFTSSFSDSNAGNVNINILENISLAGTSSTYFARLEEFGSDLVNNPGPFSGLYANTSQNSKGNSGNIAISGSDALSLTIEDEAQISVNSAGTGLGGNITLQGKSLTLDRGVITAEAVGNQGGNVNLEIQDLLLLRNNSQINSSAGSISGEGNGGNINIDANLIVTFPGENSDIIANAFLGNGGRVEINTQALFGTEFRGELTTANDITASSEFGFDGVVEIDTLDIDPTRGLTEIPTTFISLKPLKSCQAQKDQDNSSFINIGRGGSLANPSDIDHDDFWEDLRLGDRISQDSNRSIENEVSIDTIPEPIVEAQGWKINDKGKVVLTTQPSNLNSSKDKDEYAICYIFQ